MDDDNLFRQKMLDKRNSFGVKDPIIIGLHNKDKLFKDLFEYDPQWFNNTHTTMEETYGAKSCVYAEARKGERNMLEMFLADRGHKINYTYWPGSRVVEIQVDWYPGYNWDE